VQAYPSPRVAIVSTGDELVEPMMKPMAGQIRNSNGTMLVAQCVRAGALPRYLGIAIDKREVLLSLIREGLQTTDVVVLSGGVSAGKLDLVPGVLEELGVQTHFHKVNLKPGRPLLFGTKGQTLVFGLPGNPVSSFVCFELVIRPALRKLRGHTHAGPDFTAIPLASKFETDNNRPTFGPGKLIATPDGLKLEPIDWFGSADLRALSGANALWSVDAGKHAFAVGDRVPTLLLNH
jgi:molybdopterin molybdotransferase